MSQHPDSALASTTDAVRSVATAVGNSDYEGAARLADAALAQGLIHPAFFNARALWLERQGRDEDALTLFQQTRALTPRDPRLLNAIGLCLTRLWRLEDAIATFDEAIRIEPAYAATYQRKGLALSYAGREKEAEQAWRRSVQLDPRNAEALASLAAIAARKGNFKAARSDAERALRAEPNNATALAALALAELAEGDAPAAEQRLRSILQDARLAGHGRAVALGYLGDALDAQDRCSEAFAAYRESNDEHRRIHAPRFRGGPTVIEAVEAETARFEAAPPGICRAPYDRPGAEQRAIGHVFLLGFHRSGTTLLGQALASHPAIATLEERDFLAEPAERYLGSAQGLESLAGLEGLALTEARAAYWQRIQAQGMKLDDRVFVDKHPFNTIKLPLILKLFPDAKILFAIRDPRDVVFSCFRRHFDVDFVKFAFLELESAAQLYDAVMGFGMLCREKLPLAFFEHRYESLIADFDGQTRAVCDFIGVEWSDKLRDFAATAQSLDSRWASAGQVKRGFYTEGVGQWRRYREEIAPVIPLLEPWIARFGYDAE